MLLYQWRTVTQTSDSAVYMPHYWHRMEIVFVRSVWQKTKKRRLNATRKICGVGKVVLIHLRTANKSAGGVSPVMVL